MDEVHVVRHKVLVEGRSVRSVAREMRVSRNTVKRYLTLAAPVRTEREARPRPRWEAVKRRLQELLEASPKWTGGKQRLTAARLHQMLLEEGHVVGATLVKEVVAEWKRKRREVFVPLVYAAGELAQVDFFEVLVDVAGKRRKAHLFVMRLMCSKRDFVWLYDRQDQLAFLDGHVRAFEHFGAVPQRIAYDNLRAAVVKVLVGAERQLTRRFEALTAHYLFEPSFCRPATGHDKGGVEARGKGIRLQHLVPIPSAETLQEIRVALLKRVAAQHDPAKFATEVALMLPLGEQPFECRLTSFVTASRSALVKVEGALYSVPSRWSGLAVTVLLSCDEIEIIGPDGRRARHARRRFGERSIDYRHYLSELASKPQAVRQVASELLRDLGEPYASAWRHLVDLHGPKQAARIFARVLALVEQRGLEDVARRIDDALKRDEPLLLALTPRVATSTLDDDEVPKPLREIDIGSGCAADYDKWLRGGEA